MHNTLTALAILSICGAASATKCPDGIDFAGHPDGNCNWYYQGTDPTIPTKAASATANASSDAAASSKSSASVGNVSQAQRQQQQQLQNQSLRNTNTAGGATVNISGNEAGSGSSSSYRATAWTPIIPAPAAPAIASANLVVVPGTCGPRVRVVTTQVVGQHYGPAGGQYDVVRGYTETVAPYLDENGNPGAPFVYYNGQPYGHIVTQAWAALGTSSAAGISGGLFGGSAGIQAGANGSSAVQQLVKGLQVMDCLMPTERPETKPPETKIIYRYRSRPVRRVAPSPAPVPCLQLCTIPK